MVLVFLAIAVSLSASPLGRGGFGFADENQQENVTQLRQRQQDYAECPYYEERVAALEKDGSLASGCPYGYARQDLGAQNRLYRQAGRGQRNASGMYGPNR